MKADAHPLAVRLWSRSGFSDGRRIVYWHLETSAPVFGEGTRAEIFGSLAGAADGAERDQNHPDNSTNKTIPAFSASRISKADDPGPTGTEGDQDQAQAKRGGRVPGHG